MSLARSASDAATEAGLGSGIMISVTPKGALDRSDPKRLWVAPLQGCSGLTMGPTCEHDRHYAPTPEPIAPSRDYRAYVTDDLVGCSLICLGRAKKVVLITACVTEVDLDSVPPSVSVRLLDKGCRDSGPDFFVRN